MARWRSDDDRTRARTGFPRLGRWALNLTTLASGVLSICLAVLWGRSHVAPESWTLTGERQYALRTAPGRLMVQRVQQFTGRIVWRWPVPAGVVSLTADPGGALALLPPADPLEACWPAPIEVTNSISEHRIGPGLEWRHGRPDEGWPRWWNAWLLPERRVLGVGWASAAGTESCSGGTIILNATAVVNGRRQVDPARFRYRRDAVPTIYRIGQLTLPLWLATVVTALLPCLRASLNLGAHRRLPGHCRRCGYDLRASRERCPECGRPV